MKARKAQKNTEEVMSIGSSVPVEVLHGVPKGALLCDKAMTEASLFIPFTAKDQREGEREGGTGVDRDLMLMEHLPTVRYLARRIHERLPQHVELDDLISAGVVGLIDAFQV
ncbi:MAG: hypothetical protein ABI177_09840 [Edaphobacter sp.]